MNQKANGTGKRQLDHKIIAKILGTHGEACSEHQIGHYANLDDLAEKVRSSKNWSMGEVFACALDSDRFVVMKQVAPASCEMVTITQNGFHDVLTAFRFGQQELVDQLRVYVGEPLSVSEGKVQPRRWFVGGWDHTWSWAKDGRMEVKCRVVIDVTNEKMVAAQVWGYENWYDADSAQTDDLAKSLFVENNVNVDPKEFDFAEIDRLPTWAACAAADQQLPPYQDDEVIGLDKNGCVMQWNCGNGMPINSGESLEEFGLHNLREHEISRVGVPGDTWRAAVAVQAGKMPVSSGSEAPALWERDDIQFPRLLAEVLATQDLDMEALSASMDLTVEEVTALFDRAERTWEAIKATALASHKAPAAAM